MHIVLYLSVRAASQAVYISEHLSSKQSTFKVTDSDSEWEMLMLFERSEMAYVQLGKNRLGKNRLGKLHGNRLGKNRLGKNRLGKFEKCAVGQIYITGSFYSNIQCSKYSESAIVWLIQVFDDDENLMKTI